MAEKHAEKMEDMMVPAHVAVILDGNGRWAKKRGLPRSMGHREGCKTVEKTVELAARMGIQYLTVYGFSTENWKRPVEEVSTIMDLLRKYLLEAIEKMERDRVKMRFFGDLSPLPEELRKLCLRTEEISTHYEGCQVNICLNYGGRDEILRAARSFAARCAAGEQTPEELTEEVFSQGLWSEGITDPYLMISP